jgi:hypothetical protein
MIRKTVLALTFVLGFAGIASAQTPVTTANQVAFDQSDYANVTRFELRVDSGAWVDVGKPAATGAANTVQFALPAMTVGPHTLTARACNAAGCSAASTGLNVVMVIIPGVPANPRIVAP